MRSKAVAIESLAVMIVLILFAFVVFTVIDAGAGAYAGIVEDNAKQTGARVAYSYISMKVRQNDTAGAIEVIDTKFGDTLRIDIEVRGFETYIFLSDGVLYECIAKTGTGPSVAAANKITQLDGFSLQMSGSVLNVQCEYNGGDEPDVYCGAVGIRS